MPANAHFVWTPAKVGAVNSFLSEMAATSMHELRSFKLILPSPSADIDTAHLGQPSVDRFELAYLIHRDQFGPFIVGPKPDPIPPFPCAVDETCTADHRSCRPHKYVLFVRNAEDASIFSIPWPAWEPYVWIKQRIFEAIGMPPEEQHIIYAGCQGFKDYARDSRLQFQSTLHLIRRKVNEPVNGADDEEEEEED